MIYLWPGFISYMFTSHKNDIIHVIFSFHIERSKFWGKLGKFCGNSKWLGPAGFTGIFSTPSKGGGTIPNLHGPGHFLMKLDTNRKNKK